jgi:cytochrome c
MLRPSPKQPRLRLLAFASRSAASLSMAAALVLIAASSHAQVADPCLTVADSELKKVLLTSALVNPMEIAIAPDKRIFIVEKVSGKVRIYDPATSQLTDAATIPVFSPTHEGLLGIALDPNFATNHFVYVYYSHATEAKHELARFTESGGKLADATKKIVLTVTGVRWSDEHHSSGSLAFGPDGNLYLATGENVDPTKSQGYASVNEALRLEDTQATAANTNDLNGKILRIHPEADGTYTIPTGNLFATTAKTKGEIYAMGMRNPIRIAIDSKTGWVYWGEPGADATAENSTLGPEGRDEINCAKAPGFFGWPYFVAENLPYVVKGVKKDPARPVNKSPNNTGDSILPAAQPALLAYKDGGNSKYAAFGNNSARAAIIGGVYRFNEALKSSKRLPPRYDGSLFIMDWSRDWINEVTFTAAGDVANVMPFIASQSPDGPIDMAFGPDGDMFLLEYDAHALYQVQYTGKCVMDAGTGIVQSRMSHKNTHLPASLGINANGGRVSHGRSGLKRVKP